MNMDEDTGLLDQETSNNVMPVGDTGGGGNHYLLSVSPGDKKD